MEDLSRDVDLTRMMMNLRLLVLGEFKIRYTILLLSLYGVAILSIPLALNSYFETSQLLLSLPQSSAIESLTSAMSTEALASYAYIEVALFMGFAIAGVLSGISFARKSSKVEAIMAHLGERRRDTWKSSIILLGLISVVCAVISYAISLVVVSVVLYVVSFSLGIPYILITVSSSFGIYFVAFLVLSFVSLLFGWSRRSRGLSN